MTKIPMERHLLDMPYVVLFEICRKLPKGKLFEISRFSSKLGTVAKDTRLWKDVYIKYEVTDENYEIAFEELYPGPFPVKEIDLMRTFVIPPASFETDQVVNVKKLNWSASCVQETTMKAMLTKYQCTELDLVYIRVSPGHIEEIAPEVFSKQTGLEVLSLEGSLCLRGSLDIVTETEAKRRLDIYRWLATVLSQYCKNLKSLDLSDNDLTGLDLAFVKNLPTTLEKLYLIHWSCPGNSFFELLAEHRPNLKEIGLPPERLEECPALLKFKFLEALCPSPCFFRDIRDLYKYLIVFPTLKNVCIDMARYYPFLKTNLEALETMVKSHGITVVRINTLAKLHKKYSMPMDGNLWLVSKAM